MTASERSVSVVTVVHFERWMIVFVVVMEVLMFDFLFDDYWLVNDFHWFVNNFFFLDHGRLVVVVDLLYFCMNVLILFDFYWDVDDYSSFSNK